jgi:heme/copper-type cytochrome/quinol oxidase subunit 2
MKKIRPCALLAAVVLAVAPHSALACATCFGKSDSDLAKAMNWGILSLLAVVVFVLGGFAAFFIYLARRASATAAAETAAAETAAPEPLAETTELIER